MSEHSKMDTTRGVFMCPECGKRQHAIFVDMLYRTMKLKCKFCGCKWQHETLSIEERKQRNREFAKRFYDNNTELVKERVKKWNEEHGEYRKEYMREYYKKQKRLSGKDKEIPFQCMRKPVAVCDKITMNVLKTYPSATQAMLYEGKGKDSIKGQCYRKTTQKGEIVYRYADDVDVNESFGGNRYRPVKITDTTTGDVSYYYSYDEAASEHYVSKNTVLNRIKDGGLLLNQYRVEYAR